MGLNIKNDAVHELVQELARLTGESQTTAIRIAVEERLARLRKRGLAEKLLKIGKDCATRLPNAVKAMDHGDLLYGPDGLPQ
jgi:antitoxin VapB